MCIQVEVSPKVTSFSMFAEQNWLIFALFYIK